MDSYWSSAIEEMKYFGQWNWHEGTNSYVLSNGDKYGAIGTNKQNWAQQKNLELSPSSNFCVIFFYLINGPEIAYVLDEIRQHKFDDNTSQNPDFISIHCILFHAETNPQN